MAPPPPVYTAAPSLSEDIAGLRQQIIANAIALFPQIATAQKCEGVLMVGKWNKQPFEFERAAEAFDILITKLSSDRKYIALLTYGPKTRQAVAAEGDKADTPNAALLVLLDTTAKALEMKLRGPQGVRPIERAKRREVGGGVVDEGLLQGVAGKAQVW